MVMRSGGTLFLMQAALLCRAVGVGGRGFILDSELFFRNKEHPSRAGHRPGAPAAPPGSHTLLQAEFVSSRCDICFACDIFPTCRSSGDREVPLESRSSGAGPMSINRAAEGRNQEAVAV